MEQISITLPSSGKKVSVRVERKKMKTARLKVYPDQTIVLSLPQSVPNEWGESFLKEKINWIDTKIESFKMTIGYAATTEIRNGYSIQMLGEDMVFVITECDKNYVYSEGKIIHICTNQPENQKKLMELFDKWWRKQALNILNERVRLWYPVVQKYGISEPIIAIRKMKTLWGSCSVNRNKVTFNLYLIKARIPYIDYVVLHELVHFIYPNHSKYFYDFLSNYMPDWKERKIVLDQDVIHGL